MTRFRLAVVVAVVVAVVIAAVAVASAFGRQAVTLQYRWTAGDEITYRNTQESTVQMSLPGMGDTTITSTMGQVQRLAVESVAEDGAGTVRAYFDAMKINMSSPQMTMSWDSAAPEASAGPMAAQIGQMMGAFIGQSVVLVLEPTGRLRSLSGMTELMEKMAATDPQMAAAMRQMGGVDQLMSDEGMRGSFAQSFGALPAEAVSVGDSWPFELKMPNPMGEMTISTTFTLNGLETIDGRRMAQIGMTQTITVAPGAAMGPMTAEIYDASGEGELLFDVERGRVHRASNRMQMPMSMSMTGPDGSEVTIDGLVNARATVELVER